jgi:hypothetical protein
MACTQNLLEDVHLEKQDERAKLKWKLGRWIYKYGRWM